MLPCSGTLELVACMGPTWKSLRGGKNLKGGFLWRGRRGVGRRQGMDEVDLDFLKLSKLKLSRFLKRDEVDFLSSGDEFLFRRVYTCLFMNAHKFLCAFNLVKRPC